MDYSWIKPGVKAEIFGLTKDSEHNGVILTIADMPIEFLNQFDEVSVGVKYDEGRICVKNLKPFNPPNWEQLAEAGSKIKCDDFSKSTLECKHNFDKSNQWIAEEIWADER